MDDVRSRIRSHLTALSAASLIVACNHRACGKTDGGYGVVDPLPAPSCVDKGMPTATASFEMVVDPDAGPPVAATTSSAKKKTRDAGPAAAPAPALRKAARVAIRFNIEGAEYKGAKANLRGEILEEKTSPDGVELLVLLRPPPASPQEMHELDITVSLTCSIGPSSFHVRLPLDGDGGEPQPEVRRW